MDSPLYDVAEVKRILEVGVADGAGAAFDRRSERSFSRIS